MEDSILKKFTILFSGSFISIVIGLLTTPIITRMVSPIEYGQLSFFNMYSNLIVLVAMIGLDQAFVKYYYEYDKWGRQRLLYRCTVFSLAIACCILALVYLLTDSNIELYIFTLHIIGLILNRFSMLLLRMQQKTKWYSSLNVLSKILYVSFVLSGILTTSLTTYTILILATTFSNIIVTGISIWLERKVWRRDKKLINTQYIDSKKLFIYGYPYIFTFAITWVFQSIDKIFIQRFSSFEEVGIYASAMSVISIVGMVQITFNTLWVPIAFEHYNKQPEDREFYSKVNKYITIIMFFLVTTLILCKDILVLLLGEEYRQAAYIMPLLIFNPLMYTISESTVNGINFKNKTKLHIIISLGACFINIIGNTLLAPGYGAQGAALSTAVSYIVFFLLRTILSQKCYYVDYQLKKTMLLTILTLLYAVSSVLINNDIINILYYVGILIFISYLYKDILRIGVNYITSKRFY